MMLAQGMSYTDIAKERGITKQAVHAFCKANTLERLPLPPKPKGAIQKRKEAFNLSPDLYAMASLKYSRKRQNTKNQKKYEFTIAFEEIHWPTHCPILGIELDYETLDSVRTEASVSFDRIDSSKGYIPGNVQIISWRANRIKNDGTADEHRKIAEYMDMMSTSLYSSK